MKNEKSAGPLFHFAFCICHFAFFIAFLPVPASAEVSISLPLEGHYRAGHYMPVRVTARGESGAITLTAHGALPTEIDVSLNFDGVVPWLVLGESVRDVHWSSAASGSQQLNLPMKALDANERLVGYAGIEPDIAKQLFPGKTILPVSLDLSRPLLEPAAAWESLDAIVLSESAAARLDEHHRDMLLCGGMTVAIHGENPPAARWPGLRMGGYWVSPGELAGLTSSLNPDAYIPTYDWERGWPVAFRRQVILLGAIFSLLAAGIVLWPSRWAVAAFCVLCLAVAGGFASWYSRQSPMLKLEAGVCVRARTADLWSWQSPLRSIRASQKSTELTHPVFASLGQLEMTQALLICDADGSPQRFTFTISPGQSLAFFDRLLFAGNVPGELQAPDPRFVPFVDQVYVRPGEKVMGQFESRDSDDRQMVPVIVVR